MDNETPRRVEARRGFSVHYKGISLLSMVDPIGRAEKAIRSLPVTTRTLYFVESPLLGYGLDILLDLIGKDSAVLCVECDLKLFNFSQHVIPNSILYNPQLRVIHTTSPVELCSYVRREWGPRCFRRVVSVQPGTGHLFLKDSYEALLKALQDDVGRDWSNAMTLMRLGRLYARNTLRNLPYLVTALPINSLNYRQEPVLLLGAGPSLDATLSSIQTLGKAFQEPATRAFRILCVDTATKALREHGIQEDAIIALEAQHWNLRDFIGLGESPDTIIMDLSALPATGRLGSKNLYLYHTPWTTLGLFTRLKSAKLLPPSIPPLGSVGLSAVAIALSLTSGPVYIAGMDFAFPLESYHGRGTPGHTDRLLKTTRLSGLINPTAVFAEKTFQVKGKDGFFLRSDPALRSYKGLFLREFSDSGRIWDLGSGGLDLGLPRMNPREALSPLSKKNTQYSEEIQSKVKLDSKRVFDFLIDEQTQALKLLDQLSGKEKADRTSIEDSLDYCDYLWAHFPECAAGEGQRPSSTELSFLKRVRAELDSFLKVLGLAIADLNHP